VTRLPEVRPEIASYDETCHLIAAAARAHLLAVGRKA